MLDSDFRVHGTTGLRVVDASVFPRIPGFFIASAVYMVGEKAADVDPRPECGQGGRLTIRTPQAETRAMAYTIDQLLEMSQAISTSCSRDSPAGPIPSGEADGTAIVAPGTTYSPAIAKFVSTFAWQGKVFDRRERRPEQPHSAVRPERDHRQGLQGRQLARRQGMHRPRLFRYLAGRALDSRRDPRDRPENLSRQSLLGQAAADRFRSAVQIGVGWSQETET